MTMRSHPPSVSSASGGETIFCALAGVWIALALLKFGNPIILEREISTPTTREEFLIAPWPVTWGYFLFALVVLSSVRIWRSRTLVPRWLLVLPLVWLSWQCISSTKTVDRTLTLATVKHFAVCTGAFYVGLFGFSQVSRPGIFWMAVLGGFGVVLLTGW